MHVVSNENIIDSKREKLGAFYTPDFLAEYIAKLLIKVQIELWSEQLKNNKNIRTNIDRKKEIQKKLLSWKVIDPSCGDASLLLALEQNIQYYINKFDYEINNEVNFNYKTTYGVDINKTAVENSKKILFNNMSTYRKSEIKVADALVPVKGLSVLEGWNSLFSDVFNDNGGFDAVIANPPWGSELNYNAEIYKKLGYKLAKGQYDSYDLFLELCFKLAKENSPMIFIIPDSIFLDEHEELRKLILNNSEIYLIARLGEKIFTNINRACSVLLVIKRKPKTRNKTICFRLTHEYRNKILKNDIKLEQVQEILSHYIFQNRFKDDKKYKFDIDVDYNDKNIINKIEKNSCSINDYFYNGRGVEISKKGNLIECPNCNNFFAFSKKTQTIKCKFCGNNMVIDNSKVIHIISKEKTDENMIELITGEDLKRYCISQEKYIQRNIKGVNYKAEEIYKRKKILIRKTGLGINASIDYNGNYTTQSIFYYILKEEYNEDNYPLEYFLGVINSRIIFYYYLKKYGEIEWKSHPYITQSIINELPICKIRKDNKAIVTQISNLVKKQLLDCNDVENDLKIEKLVAKLYGISNEDIITIFKYINNLQDLSAINNMKVTDINQYLKINIQEG